MTQDDKLRRVLSERQPNSSGNVLKSKNRYYFRVKRVFDLGFTLFILPVLCVIILIVGVLIRLDSSGPIFFRQKRVGMNGVEFEIIKFRSMYVNSDDTFHREAVKQYLKGERLDEGTAGAMSFKLQSDPRITRIGRFIRRTSIDVMPEFFNVLHGEMTLVGPAPSLPYEVELYSPRDWLRLSGKPGLTGLWQVYGRSQVAFSEMVEMDIAYLQQQSIWLDLKLIALTPLVMITGRGGA